ncbi:MAP1S protein, partial [Nycticryphes semicollaris]|nr:MAP1S protein [Nycticryphes semicollaris]
RPGRRSDSPHDVDLCLVSPCEFEHPKSERSPSAAASPRELSDSDPSQELVQRRGRPRQPAGETPPTSVSESLPTLSDSDIPPATEDCPSILADGLESDEDSEQPTHGMARARDPLPAPMKDPHPIPAQPGICMVDPEALPAEPTRAGKKEPTSKVKRTPSRVGSAPTPAKAEPSRHPTLAPKTRGATSSARDAGDKSRLPPGDKKGPSVGDTRGPGTTRSTGARLPAGA